MDKEIRQTLRLSKSVDEVSHVAELRLEYIKHREDLYSLLSRLDSGDSLEGLFSTGAIASAVQRQYKEYIKSDSTLTTEGKNLLEKSKKEAKKREESGINDIDHYCIYPASELGIYTLGVISLLNKYLCVSIAREAKAVVLNSGEELAMPLERLYMDNELTLDKEIIELKSIEYINPTSPCAYSAPPSQRSFNCMLDMVEKTM